MANVAHRKSPALLFVSTAFVLLWVVLASFPFLWTLWGSFKVQGDFFSRADWTNALWGTRTVIETGGPFTMNVFSAARQNSCSTHAP